MPSKRKKNKRRMRRVQAQRRALEEQYGSSGKGTPGVCAVSAPVPARVPVPKTSEHPVVVAVPPVEVFSVEVPPAQPVVLEVPVTDAFKEEVVKTAEGLGQTLEEPPAEEPAVIEEDEIVAVPVSEVTSSIDEPVSIPAESEIQFEDTTPVAIEDVLEQTLVAAQALGTVETCEVDGHLPAEDPVVEVPVREETVTPAETGTETVVPEAEPAATAEVEGHAVEDVKEPAVEAEAITVELEPIEVHAVAEVTEEVHVEPAQEDLPVDVNIQPAQEELPVDVHESVPEREELPEEAAVPTEALVEPEPEPQQQPLLLEEPTPSLEPTSDPITEEAVVSESVIPVDTTVTEEQSPETSAAPEVVSETLAETIPAPEPLPVPLAKEIIQAQDEFLAQVETETIKDLSVANSRNVDAINGCLGVAEVAIEG